MAAELEWYTPTAEDRAEIARRAELVREAGRRLGRALRTEELWELLDGGRPKTEERKGAGCG